MASIRGGRALDARLQLMAQRIARAQTVSIGFMAGSTYPDGTPTPLVAYRNEFGGTFTMPERTQTVYRTLKKNGQFGKQGRFVKKKVANFASDHIVPAHTVTVPARPFFRTAIAQNSSGWGKAMAGYIKASKYDSERALDALGQLVQEQIQDSIVALTSPKLADSTIAKKGFDKPLIDTGHMLRSVTHVVDLEP